MRTSAEFVGQVVSCDISGHIYTSVQVCPCRRASFIRNQFIPKEEDLAYEENEIAFDDDDFGFIDKERI